MGKMQLRECDAIIAAGALHGDGVRRHCPGRSWTNVSPADSPAPFTRVTHLVAELSTDCPRGF